MGENNYAANADTSALAVKYTMGAITLGYK